MTTTFKFEQGPMMSLAHLRDENDEGRCVVWCSIPGGLPYFQFDLKSPHATRVVDAPHMDSDKQFRAFVRERFG
jgi:hypothetical protein